MRERKKDRYSLDLIDRMSILYTNKCNVYCRHCITNSGPKDNKSLEIKVVKDIFFQAKKINITKVGISGGEPSLKYDALCEIIDFGSKLGLDICLLTNASWAKDLSTASIFLSTLYKNGLKKMVLSTDSFHLEYIGMDRIINAIKASQQIGMTVVVQICKIRDTDIAYYFAKKLKKFNIKISFISLEPFGRAKSLSRNIFSVNKGIPSGGCCLSIHPVITYTGDTYPCCALINSLYKNRLCLGNIYDVPLEEIVKKLHSKFIFELLKIAGPGGLYEMLDKNDIKLKLRLQFFTRCEFCLRLFEAIGNYNNFRQKWLLRWLLD